MRVLGKHTDSLLSDPLLPPGGLPLPFHIRRKFSFAPQLAEISRLSLIQGFTASRYSLTRDDSPEHRPGTPGRLLIQASPTKIQQIIYEGQDSPGKQPPTKEYPTFVATITDLARPDISSSRHTIRKIHGRKNLKGSASQIELHSEDNPQFTTDTVLTPNTTRHSPPSITSLGGPHLHGPEAALQPDHPAIKHKPVLIESPIMKHAKVIPNFLRSLYIVDPRLPGNPINVMSHDMIPPGDLQDGEGLFLDPAKSLDSCDLLTMQAPNGEIGYHLIFIGDLVCQETGQTRYLMTAQVNVTRLITPEILEIIITSDHPTDILLPHENDDSEWTSLDWFDIAREECEKAGMRNRFRPLPQKPKPTPASGPSSITGLTHAIKPFYRDFFVLQQSIIEKEESYDITHLSRSLFENGEHTFNEPLTHTAPDTLKALGRGLAKGTEFATQIRWGSEAVEKWIYCVPMFGPQLSCWICLLLDGGLPCFWV